MEDINALELLHPAPFTRKLEIDLSGRSSDSFRAEHLPTGTAGSGLRSVVKRKEIIFSTPSSPEIYSYGDSAGFTPASLLIKLNRIATKL
jgi:hypothetical protein